MNYFDIREEYGIKGYLEYPQRMFRDGIHYDSVFFFNASTAELEAIDIFFAVDTTVITDPQLELRDMDSIQSTWNEELHRYDILFDIVLITVDEAKEIKYYEAEEYAESLISQAYANPTEGAVEDAVRNSKRVKVRERDKANRIAGGITLTQDEKDQAKIDQKLSEYEVKCWAASDKAIEEINKGTDVYAIKALDISTLTTWPVWVPPVQ